MNVGKVVPHFDDLWYVSPTTCESEVWQVGSWFRKPPGFSFVPTHLEVNAMEPLINTAKSTLRDWQTWKDACKWLWNSHITSAARIFQRYLSKSSMWLLLRQWGLQFLNAAVRKPLRYFKYMISWSSLFHLRTIDYHPKFNFSKAVQFFGNLTAARGCILFH